MRRVALPETAAETLFGNRDENLRFLEDNLKVRIKNDGNNLVVEGNAEGEEVVGQLFEQLGSMIKEGYAASPGDVRVAVQLLSQDPSARLREYLMKTALRGGKKVVVPRSLNQRAYLEELEKNDMVFGIGPAGTGKCTASDTLILTSDGMVEIGQLVSGTSKGQAVPISLEIHGLDGPERASHVYDGGDSETLRIRTRLGYAIEVTPEHPLLVLAATGELDWRRADQLRTGDGVALQRGQRLFGTHVAVEFAPPRHRKDHSSKPVRLAALDEDFCYVLGLIVGDGCLSFKNRVILSSADPAAVGAFRAMASRFGLHVFPTVTRPCEHVIASSQLSALMAHLDLSLGRARTKRIPRAILAAPEAMVAAFLSGLFDADGTVDRRDGTITFSTVSKPLARQVQTVLLNFGITAARGIKRGRYEGRRHLSQRLTITGPDARRFDERIGFRLERKRARRRWAPGNPNVDVVPFVAPAIRAAMRTATLTHAQHKAFGDGRSGRRRPGYEKLGHLVALLYDGGAHISTLEPLQSLVDYNLIFLEVARIQPSRARVFDLTVPGTHSFVANGFVNHNTYLAVAQAVTSLLNKSVARIVLARPAVEAGEKLGFLPGDLQDKVDPYLRPLYDALYDLLDYERVSRLLERNAIEVAPIAFMRGRTLNDAFVIIDEAQNTTTEQMKMVLTRIGFGSKVVITGDITQIDLPSGRTSGLVEAIAVLSGVKGISFVYFDEKDVVRHKLVQAVIKAYDAYGASQASR